MESSSPELPPTREPLERKTRYYQNRAERLLRRHGTDFALFTRGYEQLVAIGEEKLRTFETTGYNILHSANDMPMASKRPLIFYGNYIARTQHFGLLLATMEQEGIITPDRVRFGVRAAKVLYDPEWEEVPPELAETSVIQRINPRGEVSAHAILESIETVITFSPRINSDNEQALAIADFLRERARHGVPGAIPDSNVDPDIRATAVLRSVLPEPEFPNAIANIRSIGQAQVVVLRKEIGFQQPWRATPIEANKELVSYISGEGVLS